jgi:hypothetical protein
MALAADVAGATATDLAHEFYGRHADWGHSPEHDGAGGVDCRTCGERFNPEPADRTKAASAGSPAAATQSSIQAGQAPATAQGSDDQTSRILAEHDTPEQRLEYALRAAGRRKSDAYAAAWARCEAAGETPAAEQRHEVAYEAAHAEWTAEVASVVAGYAREIGATAPDPSSGTEDLGSPYHRGWSSGANMLLSDITDRAGGYDDGQWREHVAGYAEGAQSHAEATIVLAQAVRERAQQNPVDSAGETASSDEGPVKAHGAVSGAPARDEPNGPGLDAGTDFPGAPAARQPATPGRRPAGNGTTSAAGRTRPGGLR